jgi:hypothetical protein
MKWVGEDGLSLLHFGRKMFAPSKKGFSGARFGRMRPLAPNALDKNELSLTRETKTKNIL